MKFKEGMHRLAIALGVSGAIVTGCFSIPLSIDTIGQWNRHNKFARLAASETVKIEMDVVKYMSPSGDDPLWKSTSFGVSKEGIKTVNWTHSGEVESIETVDGQTLYPSPIPGLSTYLLIVFCPLLGFFIPWGTVRTIQWVVAGFVSKMVSEGK
jgi:hypothetical protein